MSVMLEPFGRPRRKPLRALLAPYSLRPAAEH